MDYTPGPWALDTNWEDKPTGMVLGPPADENEGGATIIARCGSVANARLIAAAPEMLEALRFALAQIRQDNDERGATLRGTQTQVEEAIAKAEGR